MKKIILLLSCLFYAAFVMAQNVNRYYYSEYEKSDNPDPHVSKYTNENVYFVEAAPKQDFLESKHLNQKEQYPFWLLGYFFDKNQKKILPNLDTFSVRKVFIEKDSLLEYRSYTAENGKKELLNVEVYPKYMGQTHIFCPNESKELRTAEETCYYVTYQKDTIIGIGNQKILCSKYIKWDGTSYKKKYRAFTYFSKKDAVMVEQTTIIYTKDVETYKKIIKLQIIVDNIRAKEKRFTDIVFSPRFTDFIDALDKNKIRNYSDLKQLYTVYKMQDNTKISFKKFKAQLKLYAILQHHTLLLYKFVLPEFDYEEDKVMLSLFE
jgi:hypothetical protein